MSSRGPLVMRPPPHQSPSQHGRIARSQAPLAKRPRSPEPAADSRAKRAKAAGNTPVRATTGPDRAEREALKEEFRQKYRRGFPHWVFHFDADVPAGSTLDRLQADIEYLGGVNYPFHPRPST
jgi:regulatory subunit for Cdc7p protein kinase